MKTDRRGWFTWLGRALASLGVAGAAILSSRFIKPPRLRDLAQRVAVGAMAALPLGSGVYLPGPDVHVLHAPEGLYAVCGKCTHLGCSLLRQPAGFSCPCHGARFDLMGHPVSGPAPRALTWYRLSVDRDQRIWLHLDQEVKVGTFIG